MEELKLHFRPEFLNRIDEVVVFNNLGRSEIGEIVDIQLGLLARRLSKLGLSLEVTPEARELLAEEGYDPVYGARPLKRAIQRRLENPLSVYILEGKNEQGSAILVKNGPVRSWFSKSAAQKRNKSTEASVPLRGASSNFKFYRR